MAAKTRKGGQDRELGAIDSILDALEGLDGESIQRVLDYVMGRLSIARGPAAPSTASMSNQAFVQRTPLPLQSGRQVSIRDLKEEKAPSTSNQMAAIVAYYVSEVAPADERRPSITAADLEKYFKQAGFQLPKRINQTLPDAAKAGYFDVVDRGTYRLNPVGYNLVVHGLPRGAVPAGPARSVTKKK